MHMIHFHVPALEMRPAVGAGCCATPAEGIIKGDLLEWRGVQAVEVDDAVGTVAVTYDPGQIDEETIRDSLKAIEYPAEEGSE